MTGFVVNVSPRPSSAVLTTPAAAAFATVLYIDLRVRKEGFDLYCSRSGSASTRRMCSPRVATCRRHRAAGRRQEQPPFWPPPPGWQPSGDPSALPPVAPPSEPAPEQPPFWPPPPGWQPGGDDDRRVAAGGRRAPRSSADPLRAELPRQQVPRPLHGFLEWLGRPLPFPAPLLRLAGEARRRAKCPLDDPRRARRRARRVARGRAREAPQPPRVDGARIGRCANARTTRTSSSGSPTRPSDAAISRSRCGCASARACCGSGERRRSSCGRRSRHVEVTACAPQPPLRRARPQLRRGRLRPAVAAGGGRRRRARRSGRACSRRRGDDARLADRRSALVAVIVAFDARPVRARHAHRRHARRPATRRRTRPARPEPGAYAELLGRRGHPVDRLRRTPHAARLDPTHTVVLLGPAGGRGGDAARSGVRRRRRPARRGRPARRLARAWCASRRPALRAERRDVRGAWARGRC